MDTAPSLEEFAAGLRQILEDAAMDGRLQALLDESRYEPEIVEECDQETQAFGEDDSKISARKEDNTPLRPQDDDCVDAGQEVDFGPMRMSARAVKETGLVDLLPVREFELDENGRVILHERSAGVNRAADLSGESAEAMWIMREEQRHLQTIRTQLVAKGFSNPQRSLDGDDGGLGSPPPSLGERKRASAIARSVDDGVTALERYRAICLELRLKSNPMVCNELRALDELGMVSLDFTGQIYLGNRGAQALFLTLTTAGESANGALAGISGLDLRGQGLGNDAAIALADLLPMCPGLSELNLARNHISETGAKRLMKKIAEHPGLERVSLDMNPAPSRVRVHLKELLAVRQ